MRTERGERQFADRDRVLFLKNERELGVKNGTLGTIEKAATDSLAVRLDDGRRISVDLKNYAHVDHGYAATVHKTQGMTVDRTHVLATPGLDAHATYVALSRHREGTALHYGRDDFAGEAQLRRTLARERPKDTALDYEPRGSAPPPPSSQPTPSASPTVSTSQTREEGHGFTAVVRRALGMSEPERGAGMASSRDAGRSGQVGAQGEPGQRRAASDAGKTGEIVGDRTGAASNSDRAKELRAMVAARVNAPKPTRESMREALAAAAKASPGLNRDQDYGAGR